MFRLSLVSLLAIAGCSGLPETDDAGDAAFVHQVVPTLLGRRVQGTTELDVLVDLVEAKGRDALVEVLLEDDGFAEYWGQLLVDHLRVERDGDRAQPEDCYGPPTLSDDDARWLAEQIATTSPTQDRLFEDLGLTSETSWIVTDLIRGAVLADRLDALYQAYVFQILVYEARGSVDDELKGLDAGTAFLRTHLNRQPDCFTCHSSSFSMSEGFDGGHDRHHPMDLDLEGSLFSWDIDSDGDGATDTVRYGGQPQEAELDQLYAVFQPSVLAGSPGAAQYPWGIRPACVTNTASGTYGLSTLDALDGAASSDGVFAGMGPSAAVSAVDVALQLQSGVSTASAGWPTSFTYPTQDGAAVFHTDCWTCHTVPGFTELDPSDLLPYRSDGRVLKALTDGFGNMKVGLSYVAAREQLLDARSWGGTTYQGDTVGVVAGDHALALGVAAAIVDNVVHDVYGARLTLEHGYPRNADQRAMLQELTTHFVEDHRWSLRALLTELVLAPTFNRQAPAAHADGDQAVWALPMVAYPFSAADDGLTGPEADANGQGDLVHRWPVPNLYRSAATALGWPDITVFNTSTGYPSAGSVVGIGRFQDDTELGFDTLTFQALWAWEWSTHEECNQCAEGEATTPYDGTRPRWVHPEATPMSMQNNGLDDDGDTTVDEADEFVDVDCDSSASVYLKQGMFDGDGDGTKDTPCWTDWIDLLVAEADLHLPVDHETDPDNSPSLRILASAIQDRLLGDADVSATEAEVLAFFDGDVPDGLDTTWATYTATGTTAGVTTYDATDGAAELRAYATTLLRTPQFVLGGLPTVTAVGTPPALRVCMPDERCTGADLRDHYDAALEALGFGAVGTVTDLAIRMDLASPPVLGFSSRQLTYDIEVTNEGGYRANASWLWVADSTGGEALEVIPSLQSGESYHTQTRVDVPFTGSLPTGSTGVIAVADAFHDVEETTTANNIAIDVLDASTWLPDHRIEDVRWVPRMFPPSIDLEFSVVNRGPAASGGPSNAFVQLETSGMPPLWVPDLGPLERADFVVNIADDCQTLSLHADAFDAVNERKEGNNEQVVSALRWGTMPCLFGAHDVVPISLDVDPHALPPLWLPLARIEHAPFDTVPEVSEFAEWLDATIGWTLADSELGDIAHADGNTWVRMTPDWVLVQSREAPEWGSWEEWEAEGPPWGPPPPPPGE